MKILFITHYTDFYGANQSLLILLDEFKRKGVEVHLLTPSAGNITEYCKKNNIQYHIRKFEISFINQTEGRFQGFFHFLKLFKYYPRLIKFIWQLRPDIIYSNTSVTDIGHFLSSMFNIKHIWHIREFGERHYSIQYSLGKKAFIRATKKASKVICNSYAIKKEVVPDNNNAIVVYNGVINKKQLNKKKTNPYPKNHHFTFSIVGLIFPKKGHIEAISAIARVIEQNTKLNVKLNIFGTGEASYVQSIKQQVIVENLTGKIIFRGFVENKEMIYSETNCLLMCSEYEAFGRATIEAMSYGVPVIGKNSGGTPEIILDEYNGYLYETVEELFEMMQKILSEKEKYEELSRNALTTASKFTMEEYAQNIYNFITE